MSLPLHFAYYRESGTPATNSVMFIFADIQPTGLTITVNGTAYAFGVDFNGQNPCLAARNFAALINADPSLYGSEHTNNQPIGPCYAVYYGPLVRLIACFPGIGGNSLTFATNQASAVIIGNATFTGGF